MPESPSAGSGPPPPAYWPSFRNCCPSPPPTWARAEGREGGEAPPPTASAPTDAAVARAHLFRSATAVVNVICTTPTLWVIDDLQWASPDSLTMLEFVLDELEAPLLLVVTVREASTELHALLARLQRRVTVETIELDELAPLVTDLARNTGEDPAVVARTVRLRTGGNPFFIHEIAKHAAAPGQVADPHAIPTAAREWIERRVASLPIDTSAALDLAAVIGLDLGFDVLLACSTLDEEDLLDRCDELIHARLLTETDPGHFSFPHAITRDAVYERQGPTRRSRLHRRVAQAIQSMPTSAGRASVLAHHFARAGPEMRPDAFAHAMEAGLESLDQAAWSLAAEQLQTAADLAADLPSEGQAARARALAQLGRARHGAGDATGAREVLEQAVTLARDGHLPAELATAVLYLVGGGGRGVALGLPDGERATLLREALDGLLSAPSEAPGHDALAGALEGELALALLLTDQIEERVALVQRSLQRARQADQGPSLAPALLQVRIAKLGPADIHDRLADADEVLALPSDARTPEQTLAALVNRHEDLLLLGERERAEAARHEATALADSYAHPYWRWVTATWGVLAAIIDGRLDDAEQLAFEATTRQIGDHPEAFACLGVNLIDIRLYQGRAGELLDLVADAADQNPHIPCYQAVLAMGSSEAGDADRAATAYDHFSNEQFANIPADTNRLLTIGVLAHTARALGRRADAPILADLLTPYADQQILLNCFGGGGSYWGPVAHQLARLARLDGDGDQADRRFDQAAASAAAFCAPLAEQQIVTDRNGEQSPT